MTLVTIWAQTVSGGVCSNFLFTTSPEIDADFCPHFTEEETETEVTQLGKRVENRIQGPELLIRAAKKIVSQQVPGTILSTLLEPPSNAGTAPGTLFSLGLLEPGTYRSVGGLAPSLARLFWSHNSAMFSSDSGHCLLGIISSVTIKCISEH